jgi:hypothetical protein
MYQVMDFVSADASIVRSIRQDAVARLTDREKLALVLKRLTETPNEAQRKVILGRLAEEVAKDALRQVVRGNRRAHRQLHNKIEK